MRNLAFAAVTLLISFALLAAAPSADDHLAGQCAVSRAEYVPLFDGARVPGSEICFFAIGSVQGGPTAWLESPAVSCAPADKIVEHLPGRYGFFARNASRKLISTRLQMITVGSATSAEDLRTVTLPMSQAAFIHVKGLVGRERTVWVLLGDSEVGAGGAWPAIEPEKDLMVPAGIPAMTVIVQRRKLNAVDSVAILKPGEVYIPFRQTSVANRRDVVTWVKVEGDDPKHISAWDALGWSTEFTAAVKSADLPEIFATFGDEVVRPVLSARFALNLPMTFYVFKNVPVESGSLQLRGGLWEPSSVAVPSGSPRDVYASPPLSTTLLGGVTVSLSGPPADAPRCSGDKVTSEARVEILQCAAEGGRREEKCQTVTSAEVNGAGDYSFTVAPGEYQVRYSLPSLSAVTESVDVKRGTTASKLVSPKWFRLHGVVTHEDTPVKAKIIFSTGTTTSDEGGHYEAWLSGAPGTKLISIATCDGALRTRYRPDHEPANEEVFDLEIPSTLVEVEVKDESGADVDGATVSLCAQKETTGTSCDFVMAGKSVQGLASFSGVSRDYALIACGSAEGYRNACSERREFDNRKLRLQLVLKKKQDTAKIVDAKGARYAVFWVSSVGQITEVSQSDAEGNVPIAKLHTSGEYVVLVSERNPLVLADIEISDTQILLHIRQAPARSFAVQLSSTSSDEGLPLGLVVDGRYVPLRAFGFHQLLRGLRTYATRDAPTNIVEIASQRSIELIIGRGVFAGTTTGDPFLDPGYGAGLTRVTVTSPFVTLEP